MAEAAEMYATMNCTADFRECTLPRKVDKLSLIATRRINNVEDIEGAQPRERKIFTKPDFMDNRDIEGSFPKHLHHSRNCQDLTLYVDDIDGARHFIKDRMLTTKRHTNPLVPEYDLPTYKAAAPFEPKFIRDAHDVSDIDGAKPKIPRTFEPRETFRNDIVGAQANWRPRHERARLEAPPHDIMQTQDISARKLKPYEVTSRVTDLNAPSYVIHGMEISDDPRYSKPKPLKKYIQHGTFSLSTMDISGATSKFAPHNVRPRREFRNLTTTQDIEGAQADTLKRCMTTLRETNPLAPVYPSLDGGKPLYNIIEPLLPAAIVKKPLIRIGADEGESRSVLPSEITFGRGMPEDDGRVFTINGPEELLPPVNPPPTGRLQLNLPTTSAPFANEVQSLSGGRLSGGRLSFRGQPMNVFPGMSPRGSGSSGNSGRGSTLLPLSGRGVAFKTSAGATPVTSARLSAREKRVLSERRDEIDLVRQLA